MRMNWNYLSEQEAKMEPDLVDLQIVLGLEHCKTKKDVLELLQDVRQHERLQIIEQRRKSISNELTQDEKETYY